MADDEPPPAKLPSSASTVVTLEESDLGQRLDGVLAKKLDMPRGRVTRAFKAGLVFLCAPGEQEAICKKPALKVKMPHMGTKVALSEPVRAPLRYAPEDLGLDKCCLFEDEHILVVNKPAGMTVHPAGGLVSGTLVNGLLYHFGWPAIEVAPDDEEAAEVEEEGDDEGGSTHRTFSSTKQDADSTSCRPGIVHRLDRHTSGVMVVAKDPLCLPLLQAQFAARTTERRYEAIVCGCPFELTGCIRSRIARDPLNRLRMAMVPDDAALAPPPPAQLTRPLTKPTSAAAEAPEAPTHTRESALVRQFGADVRSASTSTTATKLSMKGGGGGSGGTMKGGGGIGGGKRSGKLEMGGKKRNGKSGGKKEQVAQNRSSAAAQNRNSAALARSKSGVVTTGKKLRGKPAVTNWTKAEHFAESNAALLMLKLETGRTHQVLSSLFVCPPILPTLSPSHQRLPLICIHTCSHVALKSHDLSPTHPITSHTSHTHSNTHSNTHTLNTHTQTYTQHTSDPGTL
jgi:23S rRNA pseudouridine1911/1915/1917 synthase